MRSGMPTVSDQIEGFATDISVNHGDAGRLQDQRQCCSRRRRSLPHRDLPARLLRRRRCTTGLHQPIRRARGHAQPDPIFDPTTGLVDAGNWSVSTGWDVPADAVSGVYLVKLVRDDNGATNQIPFIVRNDDGPKSDIILQTSDTTWHAYNGWAGNNGQVGGNFYGDPSGTIDHPDVPDPGARRAGPRLRRQLQSAVPHARRRRRGGGCAGLSVRRRLRSDLLAGKEWLRRLLHLGRRYRSAGRRLPDRPQGLHLGRA